MVTANMSGDDEMPEPQNEEQSNSGDLAEQQLQETAKMVNNIEKRLREAVTADELKKLTLDSAKPEFRKVI